MREEDVEAVRRGYEAWNRGDVDAVLELVHPDIEWRPGADAPEAGEYRGRDGFRGFLESWLESFEDLRIVPEELLVKGDCLVTMVRQRGRGRGSGIEIDVLRRTCGGSGTVGRSAGTPTETARTHWRG
jgi:ketosteroid isomerase-like protein